MGVDDALAGVRSEGDAVAVTAVSLADGAGDGTVIDEVAFWLGLGAPALLHEARTTAPQTISFHMPQACVSSLAGTSGLGDRNAYVRGSSYTREPRPPSDSGNLANDTLVRREPSPGPRAPPLERAGVCPAEVGDETFRRSHSLLMMVSVIRALLALASLVITLSCQAQPTPETRTTETPLSTGAPVALASPSFTADQALRAVVSSSDAQAIGVPTLFPASIGSKACELPGSLALVVPATCRTEVRANGPSYTVTFTQAWDAARFHYADDPATGQLEHSWSFTVVAGAPLAGVMAIMPLKQSGAFPPQFAK